MDKIKKYVKPTLTILALVLAYFIFFVVLTYTGVLKLSTASNLNMILLALILFLFGIKLGKNASKKGFLEGLKLGGIFVLVLFLLNLLFYRQFSLFIFLYYVVMISSSTIGSMIGINLKR